MAVGESVEEEGVAGQASLGLRVEEGVYFGGASWNEMRRKVQWD